MIRIAISQHKTLSNVKEIASPYTYIFGLPGFGPLLPFVNFAVNVRLEPKAVIVILCCAHAAQKLLRLRSFGAASVGKNLSFVRGAVSYLEGKDVVAEKGLIHCASINVYYQQTVVHGKLSGFS